MSSNKKKEAIPHEMGKAFSGLIEKIKRSPNYTKQIGLQLGIETPEDGEDTTLSVPSAVADGIGLSDNEAGQYRLR